MATLISDTDKSEVDKGTVDRRCSSCKRPCRGHVGPCGSACTMEADIAPSVDTASGGPPDPDEKCSELVPLMTALVQQMAALNVNIQGVIQGQENIQRKLSQTDAAAPTYVTAPTPSPSPSSTPVFASAAPSSTPSSSTTTRLLPNGVRITEKVAKSATIGEFINLADFLPISETTLNTDMEPIVDSDGKLTFRTVKSKRSVDNLGQWMSAWNNFEFLIVSNNPASYNDMAKYRNFIQKCAHKFMWHAVYAYDCRFRSQMTQGDTKTYSSVDTDLYTSVFDVTVVRKDGRTCHRCKSREHLVTDCPFPATNQTEAIAKQSSQNTRASANEICRNFNAGKCRYPLCKRQHVCSSCGGAEPEYRCASCHPNTHNIGLPRLADVSRPPPRS